MTALLLCTRESSLVCSTTATAPTTLTLRGEERASRTSTHGTPTNDGRGTTRAPTHFLSPPQVGGRMCAPPPLPPLCFSASFRFRTIVATLGPCSRTQHQPSPQQCVVGASARASHNSDGSWLPDFLEDPPVDRDGQTVLVSAARDSPPLWNNAPEGKLLYYIWH